MWPSGWALGQGRLGGKVLSTNTFLPWLVLFAVSLISVYSYGVFIGKQMNNTTRMQRAVLNLPEGSSFSLQVRQHFPGAYGAEAMQRLLSWSDGLFASTMAMYRDGATKACTPPATDACDVAVKARHAPEPANFDVYDLVNPYVTCPVRDALDRVGNDGEGGKLVCIDLLMEKEDCVVFSLGSNGQYDFEIDILERTDCRVYTFDCTYDGHALDEYGGRHTYLKKCIGNRNKVAHDKRFITLTSAALELGVKEVTLLKMDIEGSEYDEIASWSIEDTALPEMLAIEVHRSEVVYWGLTGKDGEEVRHKTYGRDVEDLLIWTHHDLDLSDLALFFGKMSKLGYAVASREDNPQGRCCTELLFLKVVDWVF